MDTFWRAIGAVLIAVIFGVFLQRQFKETAVLFSIAVCAMITYLAVSYIKPLITFVDRLQMLAGLDREMISILLKAVGLSLITELCTAICIDSGYSAIGKVLQILGATTVLCLSIPLLDRLLELLQKILEGI